MGLLAIGSPPAAADKKAKREAEVFIGGLTDYFTGDVLQVAFWHKVVFGTDSELAQFHPGAYHRRPSKACPEISDVVGVDIGAFDIDAAEGVVPKSGTHIGRRLSFFIVEIIVGCARKGRICRYFSGKVLWNIIVYNVFGQASDAKPQSECEVSLYQDLWLEIDQGADASAFWRCGAEVHLESKSVRLLTVGGECKKR